MTGKGRSRRRIWVCCVFFGICMSGFLNVFFVIVFVAVVVVVVVVVVAVVAVAAPHLSKGGFYMLYSKGSNECCCYFLLFPQAKTYDIFF